MTGPLNNTAMTPEEYLEFETSSEARHEYVDGLIFSMSGSTEAHNIICGNFFALLHSHLKNSPCRVFASEMKVRIEATNSFYYPDVMVSCEPYAARDTYKKEPALIVEVLSPSTQAIDRREKFTAYKRLVSIREYVLVHQNRYQIEIYARTIDGNWSLSVFERADRLRLNFLPDSPFEVPVEAIYEKVTLPYVVKEDEAEYIWNAADRSFMLKSEMSLLEY